MMVNPLLILLLCVAGIHCSMNDILRDLHEIDDEINDVMPENVVMLGNDVMPGNDVIRGDDVMNDGEDCTEENVKRGAMSRCNKPKELTSCTRHYYKLGCFKKSMKATLLIDDSDPDNKDLNVYYSEGYSTDISNFAKSTHSLACRCARLSKKSGFNYMSLRMWGQCYGIDTTEMLTNLDNPITSTSEDCSSAKLNSTSRHCDRKDPEECLGVDADYNYALYAEGFNRDDPNQDGKYSTWTKWSECSVSCGVGNTTRTRTCSEPPRKGSGKECEGKPSETKECKLCDCKVNGAWSDWSPYEQCSKTCAGGTKRRHRTCTNPEPQYGGAYCAGDDMETAPCETDPCPIDGCYSQWSEYEPCSVTCGDGKKKRTRACNNPAPAYGGRQCDRLGALFEEVDCNVRHCPIDGGLTLWMGYSMCTKKCGGGQQTRIRTCSAPAPLFGGLACSEESVEMDNCNTNKCPIDGAWAAYGDWTPCPVTCTIDGTGGVQSRTRNCTNPKPQHGGKSCEGEHKETQRCNQRYCPIDGKWSDWSPYGECSKTCGGGRKKRERSCTNPARKYGGKSCVGEPTELTPCNENACEINGKYARWGDWSECSRECNGGIAMRTRTCTNPAPQNGGRPCFPFQGRNRQMKRCNTQRCSNYRNWGSWSTCTATCDGGTQKRTRTCTGADCSHLGASEEISDCNTEECPVDGFWGRWKPWSDCSKSCDMGLKTRIRECDSPKPDNGGKPCPGNWKASEMCKVKDCPIHGNWTSWSKFGPCSKTCNDGGQKQRIRSCGNPKPQFGGDDCVGNAVEKVKCNEDVPCPEHGEWSTWAPWEPCDKQCGGGMTWRTRDCSNPPPSNGGDECWGEYYELNDCNTHFCPIDGGWSTWAPYSTCTKKCGGGTQVSKRTCTNPEPQHKGCKICTGLDTRTRECNTAFTHPCPVDGTYEEWSSWGECSYKCGGGVQSRTRVCNHPKHGGKPCSEIGHAKDEQLCNEQLCARKPPTTCACEGEVGKLSCKEGNGKIRIPTDGEVYYGRTEKNVCANKDTLNTNWSFNCTATGGRKKVVDLCEGAEECDVPVNNQFFGNPCHGTYKYLRVHYECHGGVYDTMRKFCVNGKQHDCENGRRRK